VKTSNPVLNRSTFGKTDLTSLSQGSMTLEGTVNKSALLFGLLLLGAIFTWSRFFSNSNNLGVTTGLYLQFAMSSGILGFAVGMLTSFKKDWSPVTAPIYAILQGVFIGAISSIFEMRYPGLVIQAVGLTMATFVGMLFAYRSNFIKVTEKFKLGIFSATGAFALVYLVSFILGFFGISIPLIHGNGLIGILFSLFAVVIASLNLVLDFDFIYQASLGERNPKYMEWYASFGLMVTLVWLYIEILRLLAKLTSRRD